MARRYREREALELAAATHARHVLRPSMGTPNTNPAPRNALSTGKRHAAIIGVVGKLPIAVGGPAW
jgi:hypothetical protein